VIQIFTLQQMSRKSDYTTLAHRYTSQFPLLTYVGTQTNFWIIANILLAVVLNFHSLILGQSFGLQASRFGPILLIAVLLGVLYGVSLGLAGYYLDRILFKKLPLGKVILLKALGSLTLLIFILSLLRYVLFESYISPLLFSSGITWNGDSWTYLFYLLLVYYSFMTLLISFINQVNRKYGPGILLPLLLGRYRDPKEQDRIFMFMDLKSSTATAEKLGHLKYSSFIRDCFSDINEVLYTYRAQVYQYVGDEIVVTWPESEGVKQHFCVEFYFACKNQFRTRSDYYVPAYGLLPDFKAGAHTGTVTAVEIGEVKRDIAYHGDTLNTASRIQSVCNEYEKNFIVSKELLDKVGPHPNMKTQELGSILLKGKTVKVDLVSIEWADSPSTN
jgi:adenylate cyclase